MHRGSKLLLADMVHAAETLLARTAGLQLEELVSDLELRDAVLWQLQVLGEACKGVAPELKAASPQLPWRKIAGLRDRLVHAYFGVDWGLVWQAITLDIPGLLDELRALLDAQQS
jgi:uncharacterized protein with HEPN domain